MTTLDKPDDFIVPVCHETISIIYQDDSLLVINKPTKLLSLSGKNPANKDSVHYRLVKDFPTATMVHRLDFGTSGVLIIALNKAVNAHLTKQFQARSVIKTYTAILWGHVSDDEGVINIPVAKDSDNFPLQKICHETGKEALTHYKVMERLQQPRSTRVAFKPLSGRTHQLRIHSREIGHPILGCDLYKNDDSMQMAERLLLHADSITFDHPVSGEKMNVLSACPF